MWKSQFIPLGCSVCVCLCITVHRLVFLVGVLVHVHRCVFFHSYQIIGKYSYYLFLLWTSREPARRGLLLFYKKHDRKSDVNIKHCLWGLSKLPVDMSWAHMETLAWGNYFVWLHRDRDRQRRETFWKKNCRSWETACPSLISDHFRLQLLFLCLHPTVWFFAASVSSPSLGFFLLYRCHLSLPLPTSLSSPPPLYPLNLLALPLCLFADCLHIHSSTLACPLMAVAGVLPGAWPEQPGLSL